MRRHDRLIYVLICVMILTIICGIATEGMSQSWYPGYYGWGFNPYYLPILPEYFGFLPPPVILSPQKFINPLFSPPVISSVPRIAAATIIILNPTAATPVVTIINPTVTAVPTVTAATAPASPSPLLSLLVTNYVSALYAPALLTTANPLLSALLQNLFL